MVNRGGGEQALQQAKWVMRQLKNMCVEFDMMRQITDWANPHVSSENRAGKIQLFVFCDSCSRNSVYYCPRRG